MLVLVVSSLQNCSITDWECPRHQTKRNIYYFNCVTCCSKMFFVNQLIQNCLHSFVLHVSCDFWELLENWVICGRQWNAAFYWHLQTLWLMHLVCYLSTMIQGNDKINVVLNKQHTSDFKKHHAITVIKYITWLGQCLYLDNTPY